MFDNNTHIFKCNVTFTKRDLQLSHREKNSFLPDLTGESNRYIRASLVAQPVKNWPAMQETQVRSMGWGRSPGEGNGNPLQYSCLENFMARGAWWATVHEVTRVAHDLASKSPWVHKCLYVDKRYIFSKKDILEVERRDHTFFLFLFYFFGEQKSLRRHLCWTLRQK